MFLYHRLSIASETVHFAVKLAPLQNLICPHESLALDLHLNDATSRIEPRGDQTGRSVMQVG
jgi:hypothetical protein